MKCKLCGTEIPEGSDLCSECRECIGEVVMPEEEYDDGESPVYTNFTGAIRLFFKNYFNFTGRSTRSEYWYAILFIIIVAFALAVTDVIICSGLLSLIWKLLIFIPSLAMNFRRLHDVGKKGTLAIILEVLVLFLNGSDSDYMSDGAEMLFIFLAFVGFILAITQLAYCCSPSDPHDNEYGRAPH